MFQKNKLSVAVVGVLMASVVSEAQAQIEEIVVTATRREASTQDVPVAVRALSAETLAQLGVATFTDYLQQLPGVTASVTGPGQNTLYIRGIASTTSFINTAGVVGLAPNVGFYLDEQPLMQPGRNLDVYAADIARIEVLSGPQGTLFGASSQAGTVRLISNKPDPSGSYGKISLGSAWVNTGEPGNKIEAMLNLPLSNRLTLRSVIYRDQQGGWVDSIAGTRDASQSGRFRAAGTQRANGVPVEPSRAGSQAGDDLSGIAFLPADNTNLDGHNRTGEDFNNTTYLGGRLGARYNFNDDWILTATHARQEIESDGVFYSDPNLGTHKIDRFAEDSLQDNFHNTSWTVEGRLGNLQAIYTGSFADRDTDQRIDDTDYLFTGGFLPIYICDNPAVGYPDTGTNPGGVCHPPYVQLDSRTDTEITTHEIRLTSDDAASLYGTIGAFHSDMVLSEWNDYAYPSVTSITTNDPDNGAGESPFSPNYPYDPSASSTSSGTSYAAARGPLPPDVLFRNDYRRSDKNYGLFGELNWRFAENFTLTAGARHYDIEVGLEGSSTFSWCKLDRASGRVKPDASCGRGIDGPNKVSEDGIITRLALTYTPADNVLLYGTRSEGFRPGLLNRPGGVSVSLPSPPGAMYTIPEALGTDEVINYEFGWKTDLRDNTLRFNGSIFHISIENMQATISDPGIISTFYNDNAANAKVTGVEGDLIWTPIPGLTIAGAFSHLNSEITEVLIPTSDIRKGDTLAYAPKFQANIRLRYEWPT
ncbi:MAG: TonB-dependent receptor, partial [Pseudohongiellaceae bacterium]